MNGNNAGDCLKILTDIGANPDGWVRFHTQNGWFHTQNGGFHTQNSIFEFWYSCRESRPRITWLGLRVSQNEKILCSKTVDFGLQNDEICREEKEEWGGGDRWGFYAAKNNDFYSQTEGFYANNTMIWCDDEKDDEDKEL